MKISGRKEEDIIHSIFSVYYIPFIFYIFSIFLSSSMYKNEYDYTYAHHFWFATQTLENYLK